MADPLEVVFEAIKERLGNHYSLENFKSEFNDWEFEYIYRNDKCIGATLSKDGFIHIGILPEYRNRWAKKQEISRLIRKAMVDGKAYTTVFRNDEFRCNFAKRLGFKLIKDGYIQTYEVSHADIWK